MEILRNVNDYYVNMLGINPVDLSKKYRWNSLIISYDIDEGKVMLNGLTRAIVFLKNNELENIYDIKTYEFLYRSYFLVLEDFNEIEAVQNIRKKLQIPVDDLYFNVVNRFTILTTLGCNARCKYCYELNLNNKKSMTSETALKVAEYITSKANSEISLGWFGGEPLVNYKVINLITNYLKERNFKYKSDMITNGYLFTEDLINKAEELWNLQSVQITLDGTEEVYNKTKNYIKFEGSPFKRVINNIGLLLNKNISVSIRLNVSEENGENLLELIDILNMKFGAKSGLAIYCRAIFDSDNLRTEEQNKIIYGYIKEIENKLQEYDFTIGKGCDAYISTEHCMADDGHSVLINPEGKIGTCEHYVDSDFFGSLTSSIKDIEVLKKWHEYMPDLDICKNCPIYAECLRPAKCVELRHCDRVIKDYMINEYKIGVRNFYLNYRDSNPISSVLLL